MAIQLAIRMNERLKNLVLFYISVIGRRKMNKFQVIVLFCSTQVLLGCVSATSKNMAANFGGAAKTLTNEINSNIVSVRNAESDFKISTILADTANSIGVANGLASPFIKPEDVALRVGLLSGITKYAEGLLVLAGDSELERIDTASRNLYTALGSLNQTIQKNGKIGISDSDLQIIAATTDVAGRWFFEKARLEAIESVVSKAEPVIQQSVELLENEIKKGGAWSKSLNHSLSGEADNLYKLAIPLSNIQSKKEMLIEARQLKEKADTADAIFGQLNSSLANLGKAHTALKVALENDSDINIQNGVSNLAILENEINRIQAFKDSLTTNKK